LLSIYRLIVLVSVLSVSACATVTIQPRPVATLDSALLYEERKSFYWWGLSGEQRVDVRKICGERQVLQMQSQRTFTDTAFTVFTLGIYAPHTVKVWCEAG